MLTDLNCKAVIQQAIRLGKPIKKADGKGLFLYAQPKGNAYWRYKYRLLDKENQISFGSYPMTSLSEARTKHAAAYKQVAQGNDPSKVRQEELRRAKRAVKNTFEAVGRSWHRHNLEKWSASHANNILLNLERDLFLTIGKVPVSELGRKQLLEALQKIEARKAHETVRRSLQYTKNILNYALDEEHIQHNVALGLGKSLKPYKTGHYPSMDIDELPIFLQRMKAATSLCPHARDAIELLMLTLVRRNELLKAQWSEINFEKAVWVIPAHRMKMRKEHIVPLSKQALAILLKRYETRGLYANQYSPYVFPATYRSDQHIHLKTVSNALHILGYKDKHTAHGFRALGMGIAKEKLGYRHEVPDRQLAHVPANEVDKAYDRAKFIPERFRMMQELADYIDNMKRMI